MNMHASLSMTVLLAAAMAACENNRRADTTTDRNASRGVAASGTSLRDLSPDAKVLSLLHCKNQEEIRAAQLARQNATTDASRQYAEMMIRDHTDADRKVMDTARQAGVTLVDPETFKMLHMQEKGKSMVDDPIAKLSAARGMQFDQMYADEMHKGHSELVQELQAIRPQLRDQRVAGLVDQMLPIIQSHTHHAMALKPGGMHNMPQPQGPNTWNSGVQPTNTNVR